jgi:hypothetical protein
VDIRRSSATERNRQVKDDPGRRGLGNRQWLARRATPGAVVFLGGATLIDFRVRVAQSAFRQDLLPSFWSLVGIADSTASLLTVPLSSGDDVSRVPMVNGIQRVRFTALDDPDEFPNVAVVRFAEPARVAVGNLRRLETQRSAIDVPSLIVPWLGFAWAAGGHRNPLLDHVGLPSAAVVETAFGMSGIELTPGLASGSSCPEAIWQAAVWWHDYYRQTADVAGAPVATDERQATSRPTDDMPRAIVPEGRYWVRQEAAAVTFEPRRPAGRARRAR